MWFADGERRHLYEAMKPLMRTNGETRDRDFTLAGLRTLASDIQRVADYIEVLDDELTPRRQYGTGEIVERTLVPLPSLEGIEPSEA